MKKSILIAGGSGLVGSRFIELIDSSKYDIYILSRNARSENGIRYFEWNFNDMTIDENAVKVDYIINLNGAGIADKKWTPERKKLLIESRVKSAKLIKSALEKTGHSPKVYISASAIGFYGDRKNELLDESSEAGIGFLAECCKIWEESASELKSNVDRLVINRIGIVLSSKGGALPKILMTKSLGLYNYFGNGQQYYSWIHIDDLCRIILSQIEDKTFNGIYNAVTPSPLTNKEFTSQIKDSMNGILMFPAPAFGLRLALGEMADVVLNSSRVIPKRLEQHSFDFKFNNLGKAVIDLVNNKK